MLKLIILDKTVKKLFLLENLRSSSLSNVGDYYDSCVVCASRAEEAKTISPEEGSVMTFEKCNDFSTWSTNMNDIKCTEIGLANNSVPTGIVLSSFISLGYHEYKII